ncbi:MAG: 16S rRNA (adenine(1518)-N(6)/adenine(1519)-N(6))-dimethyltransferase RsmA [Acholeplasmataceae bacterium]|nr:16S rRNA (adenine(1518)-N(6)/adenine(1519)-N(6))-dimethyltransferase RsmA [Acholeplasmataceae bacterium]
MIGNSKKTQMILDKYDIRAKKSFGQNFLIDENILKKIALSANLNQETGVLEIGPGIGALTEVLLTHSQKVLAFEIDWNFIEVLNSELKSFSNFKLLNKDFLKADLASELDYLADCKRIIAVSNLPYYITSPIIIKLLENENGIEEFYFMVQKEVGERLTSEPGTKDYGSLTVLIKYKTEARILFPVSRNSFIPKPNVDSVVIGLRRRKIDLGIKNEANFLKFVQAIFSQRRKTLYNNIMNAYQITRKDIEDIFPKLGVKPDVRSEALNLKQIAQIYISIFEAPK